jgi:hypothetical protein
MVWKEMGVISLYIMDAEQINPQLLITQHFLYWYMQQA